jgi:LPS-assembly protein
MTAGTEGPGARPADGRRIRQARRGSLAAAAFAWLFATAASAQIGGSATTPPDLPDFLGAPPLVSPAVPRPGLGAAAGAPAAAPEPASISQDTPVTFTADEVEYDRERGIVTARGRVEAWQGERFLRADEFSYDRNTGVVRVRGNVELQDPDGQVLFADEAELRDRLRDGVLQGVRALLAANGRLAATAGRRTGGVINELARVVYSPCNLCPEEPTAPPLWQVQARRAIQDKETERITYRDAQLRFFGWPVLYTPYLSHPDPSAPRATGFLFPTIGGTRFLGGFVETPYFWAIDQSSDLTIRPIFATRQAPNLGLEYRKLFNFGEISANGSVGWFDESEAGGTGRAAFGGHIFSRGRFSVDENWRVGFDLNRATSELYLRTYRYEYRRVLTSQAFAEGFWGTERYVRADSRAYQGLRPTDDNSRIPFVLPNLFYEQAPREKVLGGFLTADANVVSIYRQIGSQSQRLATRLRWERPEIGRLGEVWTLRAQGEALGYYARGQDQVPANVSVPDGTQGVGNLRAALDWRWPLVRDAGIWGHQMIEPRVQFVTGPNTGRQTTVPNEDSVDFEFTDANLFALNRFTGRDRQEGGSRVDAALGGAWNFRNGGQVEGLIGRSFAFSDTRWNPYPQSGLDKRASDYVARLRVAPVPWFETIGRVRTLGEQPLNTSFVDTIASVSFGPVSVSAGYFESPPLPYLIPSRTRREVGAGFGARIGEYWRISVSGSYDLKLDRAALVQGAAGYEDECFIIEGRFVRRFAEQVTGTAYPGNTLVLMRIGFKTLGEYFFRAI